MTSVNIKQFWNQPESSLQIETELALQESDWQAKLDRVQVKLSKTSTGFDLQGTLEGTLYLCCDRCLEPFEEPLDLTFEERFVLKHFTQPGNRGKEVELLSEDFFEVLPLEAELDLADLCRQTLLLEVPPPYQCGCLPLGADESADREQAADTDIELNS